jgi:hypothetical protein
MEKYEWLVQYGWLWDDVKSNVKNEIDKYMAEHMKNKQWEDRKFQTAGYTYEWNWTSLIENKKES